MQIHLQPLEHFDGIKQRLPSKWISDLLARCPYLVAKSRCWGRTLPFGDCVVYLFDPFLIFSNFGFDIRCDGWKNCGVLAQQRLDKSERRVQS
jgi:hypothetical protein